jgi:hypothetical protein
MLYIVKNILSIYNIKVYVVFVPSSKFLARLYCIFLIQLPNVIC